MQLNFTYKEHTFCCDIGMMTRCQYEKLIDMLDEIRPMRICELGSGQSTEIFEKYAKNCNVNCNVVVHSIEHDKYFMTHKSCILFPLEEKTNLTVKGQTYENCNKYIGLEEWLEQQDKFDLVLVDGPNDGLPTNIDNLSYSRIQIVDFVLMNKLKDNSIVMFHDSEKEIAQNTLKEFENLLEVNGFNFQKEVIIEPNREIVEYHKKYLETCGELSIYKLSKH